MTLTHSFRYRRWITGCVALLLLALWLAPGQAARAVPALAPDRLGTYNNPLNVQIPQGGRVESCADPSIIHAQTPGDTTWTIYCTTDPLNGADRDPNGNLIFHRIPMLQSTDLVNWTYMGDAFSALPPWVNPTAGLWAPDIEFFNGQYYLYYTASDTSLPGGGSAIGVATSSSPLGPWVDSGGPVVEPHDASCCPGSRRWVFDPDVIQVGGQNYIFYGSYFGGISARTLSADGLHSDPASQTQITIANRYEGANIVQHGGYFYLLASATDCCHGPLTGYSVFAGRSQNILGPYVDREGVSLLAGRVGGSTVLSMNGNRWVGTGHNAVFTDFGGQDWTVYHAVDRDDPYFTGSVGFTKRPVLMDPLDWVDGWPSVRAGRWASEEDMPAPAAQPGQHIRYTPRPFHPDTPGNTIARLSDEFNSSNLSRQWDWIRQPVSTTYGLGGGLFRFDTQNADLFEDSNNASVLTEPIPGGNYLVETKVRVDLPPEGCCYNYRQAGLVIYGDDDNFVKLAVVSIYETRQTEFAKEWFPIPAPGYPRYGNTVVGPPGDWTWLRIAKRTNQYGEELYTAYTSADGQTWEHGGTWTRSLGAHARIGLVSMGGAGSIATFDYVHVTRIDNGNNSDSSSDTSDNK